MAKIICMKKKYVLMSMHTIFLTKSPLCLIMKSCKENDPIATTMVCWMFLLLIVALVLMWCTRNHTFFATLCQSMQLHIYIYIYIYIYHSTKINQQTNCCTLIAHITLLIMRTIPYMYWWKIGWVPYKISYICTLYLPTPNF